MKISFYASVLKKYEMAIGHAFVKGCSHFGDRCDVLPIHEFGEVLPDTDVAVVVGIKSHSGPTFKAHLRAGRHAVYIDKGYTRIRGGELGTLYWRTSVDAFQPLKYLHQFGDRGDRWDALGVKIRESKQRSNRVLFAGSSQKYCSWHALGDANDYANAILDKLARYTRRELIYRPKPSWGNGRPVGGFAYSGPSVRFGEELSDMYAIVTHGSNACFEAMLNGIPSIVLGDGITKSLSSSNLKDIESLRVPSVDEVYRLASSLAYFQWTLKEMEDGTAWQTLRPLIEK